MSGHLKHKHSETHHRIEAHIRKHRASGGKTAPHPEPESPKSGDDDAEKDLKTKPMRYTADSKVEGESERKEVKTGGRASRARGGMMKKDCGSAEGEKAMHHAGRKHRASGGSAEDHPFTGANKGTPAKGRKIEMESMGKDA
jgi:hypothetical protein